MMPTAVSPAPRVGMDEPDDLDRMLDYENAVEDFLSDIPIRDDSTQQAAEQPRDEDQEVQVKRKRKPVPKLDEERLLSEAGLPRLRKITKSRLRFRGKHHEFSDISRLLNTYQLWLDDLYPRAKFRDALGMVERLGHTKRMQVMRKAWLDSTKPNRINSTSAVDETPTEADGPARNVGHEPTAGDRDASSSVPEQTRTQDDTQTLAARPAAPGRGELNTPPATNVGARHGSSEPDEDELDALLAENKGEKSRQVATRRVPFEEDEDDEDDEDELDALLAEQLNGEKAGSVSNLPKPRLADMRDEFADEEAAMAEMGGMW